MSEGSLAERLDQGWLLGNLVLVVIGQERNTNTTARRSRVAFLNPNHRSRSYSWTGRVSRVFMPLSSG